MRRTMIVATAATLLLSGCGSGSDASGGDENDDYRVIVLGGISTEGVLADNAATSVLSAEAGVKWVNDNGGIGGRDVVIDVIDDAGDPTTAVTKLREAIAEDPPDLVLNSGPSTVAEATLPILKQSNILSFNVGPTATSADANQFPLNFDLSASASDQIAAYVPYFEEQGYTKVGILHGSSSYGETYGAGVEEVFDGGGFEVVGKEEYDVAALDMTAQLEAIQSQRPDVLILDAYGAPLGYVLKGVEKLGWDVPIVGNTSVAATTLVSSPPPTGVLGTPAIKNLRMQVYKSTAHDPKAKLTNDAVKAMTSLGEIKANLILAYNFDALPLVQAAAEDAGSTDPEEVATSLEKDEVQDAANTAILSKYNFTGERHDAQPDPAEFTFITPSEVKDGQFR